MARILIAEDDAVTADAIAQELARGGHDPVQVDDGGEALARASTEAFDAITLDRMLPTLDGLAIVQRLRQAGIGTPVLMISALSDVDERIAGLRAGGDDYLTKPFAPDEMAMRVEALLRRTGATQGSVLHAGAMEIDLIRRAVSVDGAPIRLLHMEFKLLEFLARNLGKTVSRQVIFEQVWGYHFDPGPNVINVHIARLRKKLDRPDRPSAIVTLKGEGYRLDAV
jgi:two-component system, OmpR family, response regulator